MEEIIEQIKVYVDLDEHQSVVKVFSSYFEEPKETSILIDEGFGDKYKHCQNNYFLKSTYLNGKPRYFYDGSQCLERPLEELQILYPTPTSQPTQLDRIESLLSKKEEDIIDNYTLSLINSGIII